MKWVENLKFDEKGLIPAIVQDAETGEVLMMAYMNEEAVRNTLAKGLTHFWSRSRGTAWVKGESSGHTQAVEEVRVDCDADTLLIRVRQKGGACHEGYRSCFFRRAAGDDLVADGEKLFDPKDVYK